MSSELSFRLIGILWMAGILVGLVGIVTTRAGEQGGEYEPRDTRMLGGVPHPTAEELAAMHKGQYILHARGGKLTKVAVEKNLLPHDPEANPQTVAATRTPDGTVYVQLNSITCKSTDGGRTWTSYKGGLWGVDNFQTLSDGTFIGVVWPVTASGEPIDLIAVMASSDEGRTWWKIAQIRLPGQYSGRSTYGLFRLPDDTLLCGIAPSEARVYEYDNVVFGYGVCTLLAYRSSDRGRTWEGPAKICDWSGGGGIAQTASGKLLAVLCYKRPALPTDPPDLVENMLQGGTNERLDEVLSLESGDLPYEYPYNLYKHIFLADSEDEGRSWQNFRQLTTVYGQYFGYPAALSDGTVVVIHDTRYGPGHPGSRAMISYDEGQTWADEVYYLDYTNFTGSYNASVVLEDDLILTIVGTSEATSWEDDRYHTDFTAIRWKPVKEQ